jgi:uncharacterized protein (TIGR02996 family)
MISADDFFHAILEDPDSDEPRLVFADWLEEHGNPRSEFVRLQCELEQLPEDHPERSEREARSRLLLSMHEAEWVGGLRAFVQRWKFHRGFVDWVHVPARMFLAHAEDIFQLAPIRKLSLGDVNPYLEDLAKCPYLERVVSLQINPEFSWRQNDYPSSQLTDHGVGILASSPHLQHLQRLDLGWNQLTSAGAAQLASSQYLQHLTALDLSDNDLDEDAIVTINGWHECLLATLALSNNHLGDRGMRNFHLAGEAAAWNHAKLNELHLASNQISGAGIEHLAFSKLTALKILSLDGNEIDANAIRHLANSPVAARLVRLSLSSNRIGDEGVSALVAAPCTRHLTHLYLRYNQIGPEGVQALAASPHLENLVVLDLGENSVGDAGVRALAESPYLAKLRFLNLFDARITALETFAKKDCLPAIEEIRLGNNPISAGARQALQRRFGHRVIFDG